MTGDAPPGSPGLTVIRRLHRMVRHGYRPWLGYDVAGGQDQDIHLRRRDGVATLRPDGTVVLPAATVAGGDEAGFDALFPVNTRNRRNLMRRLYEIGF